MKRLYHKYKLDKNSDILQNYKKCKQEYKIYIKNSRLRKENRSVTNSDTRFLYKYIKKFIKPSFEISNIKFKNKNITNPTEISSSFIKYFSSIFQTKSHSTLQLHKQIPNEFFYYNKNSNRMINYRD